MKGRALGMLMLASWLTACGQTVSEDDCVKIKENMREAWSAESKKAAGEGPAADKAAGVIKSEGEKLVTDWMAECKKELMGRRVDPKEMACLLKAKSIAAINKCSEP
jgi:hypothetical protein